MDSRSFRYFVCVAPLLLACGGVYGQPVYAVDIYNNNVTVIDSATNMLVTTIPNFIPGIPNSFSAGPCNVVVTPDGTQAFVSNFIHSIGAYRNSTSSRLWIRRPTRRLPFPSTRV